MGKIQLLDCTLRDGAYITKSIFGKKAISGIVDGLNSVGIDIIECGWLKDTEHIDGSSYFHVTNDTKQYFEIKQNVSYSVMIDWDRYNLDNLKEFDGTSIDTIRVVFPYNKYHEGIIVGKQIKAKGYKVMLQAANTLAYEDSDLISFAKEVNELKPEAVYIVDTFGAMFEEDVEKIATLLDENLDKEINLGFHAHNNQQLAFALTIHFIKMFKDKARNIVVDSSLCGMGRGAGNATTELVASYLNRKCDMHYDLNKIMDTIDIYMEYYKTNYKWGYSTQLFIAGMYQCHVNNIEYLLSNHRTSAKDIEEIIRLLNQEERRKYDYELLERKAAEVVNRKIDDTEAKDELINQLKDREILLIAPGKSSILKQESINELIRKKKYVVIGVNAIIPGYKYDYLFFSNKARYVYAKQASEEFASASKILLSNLKDYAEDKDFVFSYEHAIKHGWKYFDNAVMCALRLLEWLGLSKVSIAGFDKFGTSYNDSYADPHLPTNGHPFDSDEMNIEISGMYRDFLMHAEHLKEIEFITESIFDLRRREND